MTALAFRPLSTERDRVFVTATFLESFRAEKSAGLIAMADWSAVMVPQVHRILARPAMETILAYDPDDEQGETDLYGWLAHERGHAVPYVFYAFVKEKHRGNGIAARLMEEAGIDPAGLFHHATWADRDLAARIPRARWMPLTLRFSYEEVRSYGEGQRGKGRRRRRAARAPGDPGRADAFHAGARRPAR